MLFYKLTAGLLFQPVGPHQAAFDDLSGHPTLSEFSFVLFHEPLISSTLPCISVTSINVYIPLVPT